MNVQFLMTMLKGFGLNPEEVMGQINYVASIAQNLDARLHELQKSNEAIIALLQDQKIPLTLIERKDHDTGQHPGN